MGCSDSQVGGNNPSNKQKSLKRKSYGSINNSQSSLSSNFSYNNNIFINSRKRGETTNDSENIVNNINININNKDCNKENNFIEIMFKKHLELRKKHGCSNEIKLSKKLNEFAQDYVNKLIKCEKEFNDFIFSDYIYKNNVLGENIYISNKELEPDKICEEWYNEGKDYNYNGKYQKNTSHFTQLVWENTQKVGFGFEYDKNNKKGFAVAFYYPAGNIFSEFDKNILKKKI